MRISDWSSDVCSSDLEVEFVNGVAAQSASGLYGELRACAAIVGHAALLLGDGVAPVLDRLRAAAPDRFRGIRHSAAWDADTDVLGTPFPAPPEIYLYCRVRDGIGKLVKRGLPNSKRLE